MKVRAAELTASEVRFFYNGCGAEVGELLGLAAHHGSRFVCSGEVFVSRAGALKFALAAKKAGFQVLLAREVVAFFRVGGVTRAQSQAELARREALQAARYDAGLRF